MVKTYCIKVSFADRTKEYNLLMNKPIGMRPLGTEKEGSGEIKMAKNNKRGF